MPLRKHHQHTKSLVGFALTTLLPLAFVTPAHADLNRFTYSYGWWTQSKGGREVELYHTQPRSGRQWRNQLELEYGVTDRYLVAPYLIFDRSGGFSDFPGAEGGGDDESGTPVIFDPIRNPRAYRYSGFKIEQRYRFGEYQYKKLLPAAYLEYAQVKGAKPEAEGKLILQYDPNPTATLALNIIHERRLQGMVKPGWGYTFGAAYLADKKNDRYWYGAEALGNWTEKRHWIGPTVGGYVSKNTRLVATYAHATSRNTPDQFRLVATRQF
jgi:hypothetical protein